MLIQSFSNIFADKGLYYSEGLSIQFYLRQSICNFYLQLRTAVQTSEFTWQAPLEEHSLLRVLQLTQGTKEKVSE